MADQLFAMMTSTETPVEVPDVNSTVTPQNPEYWEMSLARFLYAGPSLVLFLIGLVGNTLSFVVFSRKNMRQSVTSVYFRVLAVSDTLVLFTAVPVFFILGAFQIDIRNASRAACKFWIPALVACCYHSCWILVFIASDRFIGVYLPHKYKKLCTRRRALIGLAVLFVVITASVAAFWASVLDIDETTGTCTVAPGYLEFVGGVFSYMDLCLLNLIPSVILVGLNIAIIVKISHAVKERQNSMGGSKKDEARKVQSPTAILMSVSLVYILCTIPTSTKFLILRNFDSSGHGAAQGVLYARSCDTLYLANHAINFILYCISGTSFRKELLRMIRKRSTKSTTASIVQSTGTTQVKSESKAPKTVNTHL